MEISEEEYIKIEKYLTGEMSEEERDSFEMNLKTDSNLRDTTEQLSKISVGIKVNSFAKDLSQKSAQFESSSSSTKKWSYISGIAASILIILTFGLFKSYQSNQVKSISDTYFLPYPNLNRMRDNSELDALKAFDLYDKASYGEAALLFEAIDSKSNPDSTRIRFYKGISYLANGNPTLAVKAFNDIQYENNYSQQVHWYLGLSYIEMQDFAEAQSQLKKIENSSTNKQSALEILKIIDKK